MRNGDYSPDRFRAQNETVNYLCTAKTQDNPESSVGLLSMAGKRIEVQVTPSRNLNLVMNALADDKSNDAIKVGGTSNFVGGLKTAQLALKNRLNKNQKQRIIMFVGSQFTADEAELTKLGKIFKKNNISVDVIHFGTENQNNGNTEIITRFIDLVNRNGSSRLINIPPGPHVMSDLVLTSGIMMAEGAATVTTANAPAPGAVDPNLDPELAMALRMSMEEERQRQTKPSASGTGPATQAAPGDEDDEDALLQQALAMSIEQDNQAPPAKPTSSTTTTTNTSATPAKPSTETKMDVEDDADVDDVLKDKDFIKSLLDEAGVNEEDLQDIQIEEDDKDKNKSKGKDTKKGQ